VKEKEESLMKIWQDEKLSISEDMQKVKK